VSLPVDPVEELLAEQSEPQGDKTLVPTATLACVVNLLRHYRAEAAYYKAVAGEARAELSRLKRESK
jgi:hypothetical protein